MINQPLTHAAAKAMQEMDLEDKLIRTDEKMYEWELFTKGNWYVSFSGGKDSTVLLYLACQFLNRYREIPHPLYVVFSDTGLEYPEIRKFVPRYIQWIERKFPRLTINYQRVRPKKDFMSVTQRFGYPVISKVVSHNIWQARNSKSDTTRYLRLMCIKADGTLASLDNAVPQKYRYLLKAPFQVNSYCCDAIKKEPMHRYERATGRFPMIATMAEESRMRLNRWLHTGCNAFEGDKPKSCPMSFWTNQDVLTYITGEGIPICDVYGDILYYDGSDYYKSILDKCKLRCTGCQRTGCVFCGYGATRKLPPGELNNFQLLKQTHPVHWNFAINGGEWDPIDGMWKPSKTPGHVGLGMGRVLDYIGVPYE